MAETPKKKVVKAAPLPTNAAASAAPAGPAFVPTPEAKAQAGKLRIFAWVAWIVAIGLEAFAIFGVLRRVPFSNGDLILVIVLLVLIAATAITGSLLWKKANRLDPASEKDKVKWFVQNQLGAIMTVIAFLPLIILILANKNMDGKQKAIAGGVGVVVAAVAIAFGVNLHPVSQEQYATDTNQIVQITGKDQVFWTKSGNVFHLCQEAHYVNLESKDNTIETGTVAQAYGAGKNIPSQQTIKTESKECGFTYAEPTPAATVAP